MAQLEQNKTHPITPAFACLRGSVDTIHLVTSHLIARLTTQNHSHITTLFLTDCLQVSNSLQVRAVQFLSYLSPLHMRVDVCIVNLFYSEGKDRNGVLATYSCTPWSICRQPHPASTWQFLDSIHSHLHRSVHMYHLICKHVHLMCTVQMSIVCRGRPACTMMCVVLPLKQLAIRPPCFLTKIWAWLCKQKKIRWQYEIGFSQYLQFGLSNWV